MCHYPDLGSDSDWSNREGNFLQPIIGTTQICHQYGISVIVSQTSFQSRGNGGHIPKCQAFAQGRAGHVWYLLVAIKNISFTFPCLTKELFLFLFLFFGIGWKQLKLAELTDLDSVMQWHGSLTQPPLRFVVDILMLEVR